MSKQAVKLAEELLDRFFRDAEGRTNRQIDVYFTLQDLDLSRDRAEPALDELVRRGLLNTFGPDIAFLTDAGVAAAANDQPLESIGPVERPFGVEAADEAEPANAAGADPSAPMDAPAQGPRPSSQGLPAASTGDLPEEDALTDDGPRIVHIGLEGNEYTVPLAWICTVGRSEDNDIVVNDKRASKRHAEVRWEEQQHRLYDLDSANGTLLNGEYVVDPVFLKPDDEIVIGRTLLLYQARLPVPVPRGPRPDPNRPLTAPEPSADLPETELPAGTEDLPEALLEAPIEEEAPPPEPMLEPEAEIETNAQPEPELLDPSALQPLGEEEDMDPTPPSQQIPRFPAAESLGEATSWVPDPPLPNTVEETADLDDDSESEATIMTTREALFGADGAPAVPSSGAPPSAVGTGASKEEPSGEQETLPPGRYESPQRQILARVEPEPAIFALLGVLRARVEDEVLPERQELLDAIDLVRRHPRMRDLARAIEDEAG